MALAAGSVGLGFAAGVVSSLSPCVVPLLPLVAGGAITACRFGLLAMAAGLAVSFTVVGLFVATFGRSLGLDGDMFRLASAVLLGAVGLVLLSPALQRRFALAAARIAHLGHGATTRICTTRLGGHHWLGQFAIGGVLGAVWSPCVGPTLGAASVLAAQGRDLGTVALVMLAFGLGAALPLLVVGALSREAIQRWRGKLMRAGRGGRVLMGTGAVAIALLIVTGLDHRLEAVLVAATPDWLSDITTSL